MKPFHKDDTDTIYCGHAIEILKELPDESVQMCMTSPPYWGLRNYAGGEDIVWGGNPSCEHIWEDNPVPGEKSGPHGPSSTIGAKKAQDGVRRRNPANTCSLCGAWRGQLGLEPTPELYVEHLMMIFREVKRVLRKDGSFYLNIGDTYAGSWSDSGHRPERTRIEGHQRTKNTEWLERKGHPQMNIPPTRQFLKPTGFQPKCMVCIPERVMFAMIEDDWILRNKLIWHKPNSMPSSVKDRFTTTWEYLYFFVKARKYYFDLDAVREPHKTQSLERYQRGVNLDRPAVGKSAEVGPMQEYKRAPQWFQDQFPPDDDYKGKFDDLFGHGPNPQSFNLRVRDVKRGKGGATAQGGELMASDKEVKEYEYPERTPRKHDNTGFGTDGKGIRNHKGNSLNHPLGKNPGDILTERQENIGDIIEDYWEITTKGFRVHHFAVYPEKLCERPIKASSRVGDVVLDPFVGSGTTGVVAKRLGRKAILIDCVESYCSMARDRLSKVTYQPELIP